MTLFRLRLTVRYDFDRPTGAGRQLLRIIPADLPGVQRLEALALTVSPTPAERREFTDFFGTRVVELAIPAGQSEVVFDMAARVRREDAGPVLDLSSPLDRLAAELADIRDLGPLSPHHFLPPSPRIPEVREIAAFARSAVGDAPSARIAVERLGQALNAAMTFDASATEVDTPIATAFSGRHGVCQDYAQIMIAGLRSLGIPAGYATGFLRTLPPPGRPRLEGADAMHAWVSAWTGAEQGWVDYDPTNACFVGADHVTVGYGRDYSDAAPVTGMLRLDGTQTGTHAVDLDQV